MFSDQLLKAVRKFASDPLAIIPMIRASPFVIHRRRECHAVDLRFPGAAVSRDESIHLLLPFDRAAWIEETAVLFTAEDHELHDAAAEVLRKALEGDPLLCSLSGVAGAHERSLLPSGVPTVNFMGTRFGGDT